MKNWIDAIVKNDINEFELGLIWSKGNSLQQIANDFISLIGNEEFDFIVGVEMKGVIYSSAISAILGKEQILFRKKGKIHYTNDTYIRTFINWKNEDDGIEIEKSQIKKNTKLVVVDDIVCTSATFMNIDSIIHEANAKVVKYLCIKNISATNEINGTKIEALA